MKIDLTKEIATHFGRLTALAEEAAEDSDESFSARASAMSALTSIIKELSSAQEKIHSMTAIQELQSAIVEALETYDQDFKNKVVEILERRLESLN